jgi:hypothetical protein
MQTHCIEHQVTSPLQFPFHCFARTIMINALIHSYVPNRVAGKEVSPSSGELRIPGLQRFIASGFTYRNLFLKTNRRNQKEYSITFVFETIERIFSPRCKT